MEPNQKFIVSLVEALNWPIVILFLAWLFKKPLGATLERLRSLVVGKWSVGFHAPQEDKENQKILKEAIDKNDATKINKMLGPHALRLLLALSGRQEELPLGLYRRNTYDRAKRRIIQLGLATYDGKWFRISKLGLEVVQQQIKQRLNTVNENLDPL